MILIRSFIYFIFLLLSVLVFSTALITIGMLMDQRRRCSIANYWGKVNILVLRAVCGLEYRITGMENLPSSNCIVMSKHQSTWETISLRGLLPSDQAWVLKKELMSVPFFGWALRSCSPIAIDRNAGRKAVKQIVDQGLRALNKGRWVIVFPEGTRVAPGERKKYGIGSALLAERSGYPIIPVAHNAGIFWRRRGLKKYPGCIDLVIGPKIDTKNKKASVIMAEVEKWIEGKVAELPADRNTD